MTTTDDNQRRIINRLKRARGQLDAVISAVEDERSCREIVPQLSAVTAALDRAGYSIVAEAMKSCLREPDVADPADPAGQADPAGRRERLSVEELEKLFLSLS